MEAMLLNRQGARIFACGLGKLRKSCAKHAELSEHKWLIERSKADGPCAQLNWTTLQPIIFDAPADVLLILDCCFASSATWRAGTSHLGSKETISACGPSSFASAVGGRSFTTALTDQLRFQAGVATLLTGAALAGYLLDSDFRLQFQPAYARSHRTERNSVALIPFPPPNAVGTGELVTSPPLNRPPRSMARVLLAVHVKGDPNDELVSLLRNMNNLAGFLRNEHALPTSVVGVNIEGVEKVVHPEAAFKSTSTLILVSVPFAAWHLLPDHGACQFVSLISGPNLLSKRPEYTAGDSEAISADNEAIAAQSFLQDSGYGNMIGDYALERFGEFMCKRPPIICGMYFLTQLAWQPTTKIRYQSRHFKKTPGISSLKAERR